DVLEGAGVDPVSRELLGAVGPVRRQDDQIRATKGEEPRGLGKGAVVADIHPEPHEAEIVDAVRVVAAACEVIDAEMRKMGFSIDADAAARADERERVVDAILVALDEPDDDVDATLSADLSDLRRARSWDRLGVTPRLIERLVGVARDRALGKDAESRANRDRKSVAQGQR